MRSIIIIHFLDKCLAHKLIIWHKIIEFSGMNQSIILHVSNQRLYTDGDEDVIWAGAIHIGRIASGSIG